MLLCISLGSTEEQEAAMENILFISLCYCYLLFSLKIPERFRRGRRKHQFGFTLRIPRVWNAWGTPQHLCLCLCPNPLSQTAVHQQMSLSPDLNTDALPSFPLPQKKQAVSPTLVPAIFSPHVSDPKAPWTCYARTVWRSRVAAPALPCLDAIQGLWAGAGIRAWSWGTENPARWG